MQSLKYVREAHMTALTYNDGLDMYKQNIKCKQTLSNMHSVKSNFSHWSTSEIKLLHTE